MSDKQQLALLQECVNRLECQIKTRTKENEILIRQIDRLAQENRDINDEVAQLRSRLSEFRGDSSQQEIEQQRMYIQTVVDELNLVRSDAMKLHQEWNEAVHRERILTKQLQDSHAESQKFRLQLSAITEELEGIQRQQASSNQLALQQVEQRNFKENEHNLALAAFKVEIEQLKMELMRSAEERRSLEDSNAALIQKLGALQSQYAIVQGQVEAKASEISQLRGRLIHAAENEEQNEHLLRQITVIKEKLLSLTIEQDVEQDRMAQELKDKQAELNEAKNESHSLEQEREGLKQQIGMLRREFSKKDQIEVQAKDTDLDVQSAQGRLMELLREKSLQLARTEQQRQQDAEELSRLKDDIERITCNNDNISRQYAKLKKRHDQLEEEYSSATHELAQTRNRNNSLVKQLEEQQPRGGGQKLDKVERENEVLRTQLSSLISINLVLSNEISELRQEKKQLECSPLRKTDNNFDKLGLNTSDITIYPVPRSQIGQQTPTRHDVDPQLLQNLKIMKSQKERLAERVFELNEMNEYLLKRNAQAENELRNSSRRHQKDCDSKSVNLPNEPQENLDEEIRLHSNTTNYNTFVEFMAQAKKADRPYQRNKWNSLQSRINALKLENEQLKQSLKMHN